MEDFNKFGNSCRKAIEEGRCAGDCCGTIPISKEIWEKNKNKIQRKIEKIMEVGERIYILCEDAKCVFLNPETKKCVIYLDRPQVCRDYGIGKFDTLNCPYIKPNGKPRTPAMIKKIQRKINHDIDTKIKRIKKKNNYFIEVDIAKGENYSTINGELI